MRYIMYCLIFMLYMSSLSACGTPNPRALVRYTTSGKKIDTVFLFSGDYPAVSGDGKKLLYVDGGIMLANLETGEQSRLVEKGAYPSWAPDDSKFAFSRTDGIWIAKSDGKDMHLLINEPGATKPSWSSDGENIAYMHNGIYVYNIADKSSVIFFQDGSSPAWSPVCSHILFDAWNVRKHSFYTIATNYEKTELGAVASEASQVAWSPDGKYILFCRTGIWLKFMDAMESGKEIRLTQWGTHPSWSGSGKWIFFSFKGFIYKILSPFIVEHSYSKREIHKVFRMN